MKELIAKIQAGKAALQNVKSKPGVIGPQTVAAIEASLEASEALASELSALADRVSNVEAAQKTA